MPECMTYVHTIWNPGCHYDIGTLPTVLLDPSLRCIHASNFARTCHLSRKNIKCGLLFHAVSVFFPPSYSLLDSPSFSSTSVHFCNFSISASFSYLSPHPFATSPFLHYVLFFRPSIFFFFPSYLLFPQPVLPIICFVLFHHSIGVVL